MAAENAPAETPKDVEKAPKILEKQPTPLQDRPDLLSALLQN
jgi:hypothetical protein